MGSLIFPPYLQEGDRVIVLSPSSKIDKSFLKGAYKRLRKTPHVTDNGWIGPDHPSTATEEWGKEMLETTANYIVDFMEEFKKIKLS